MFLGKGVEVLDTLGSSMTDVRLHRGFDSKSTIRGNKISILAFEVANIIVKGSNLMQFLSEENIQIFKKEILHSDGVQLLVSRDIKELLSIAAADKREEVEVLFREVARFGNLSIDPQWHNLDRYFEKLYLEPVIKEYRRKEAEITMQELTNLAECTFELYHELHVLDKCEQLYSCKKEEMESRHLPPKGKSLVKLRSELRRQRGLVENLKKKSLWSKSVEKIVKKLVDVVIFINQSFMESFEEKIENLTKKANKKPGSLGVAGLALHYANLITQIDIIASRSICVPPNMRDKLYNGLPAGVKARLRSRLQAIDSKEVMAMPQNKVEMEKVLHWLLPIATNTIKAHQCFGCVGEWANRGNEFGKKTSTSNNIIRLQTLYHADKQVMDQYILNLIIYLHYQVSLMRYHD